MRKQFCVWVDKWLLDKAKTFAFENHKSFSDVVRESLEVYLNLRRRYEESLTVKPLLCLVNLASMMGKY